MSRARSGPGGAEPLVPAPPRPLSFAEVTTGALEMYRRHFGAMFGTSLVLNLALAVPALVMTLADERAPGLTKGYGVGMALLLLLSPALVLLRCALARQGWNALTGGEVSVRDGVGGAWRALPRLLLLYLVFAPAYGLGYVLFMVPGMVVATLCFAGVHGVIVEDRSSFGALRRSAGLARGGFGRIFVLEALAMGLSRLSTTTLDGFGALAKGGVPASLGVHLPGTSPAWAAVWSTGGALLAVALTTPLVMAATTLLYYDRRVRTELAPAAGSSEVVGHTAG